VLSDHRQPAQNPTGSGPTNLMPRRGSPAIAGAPNSTYQPAQYHQPAYQPAPQPAPMAPPAQAYPPNYTASMPPGQLPPAAPAGTYYPPGAIFQPGALAAQPNYTPAPAPAAGQGPTFIPQSSLDEANMTADQLNERELQRIKKWRESTPGATQPVQ
jgi:DNA polymerase-3 subunit gamma/tau